MSTARQWLTNLFAKGIAAISTEQDRLEVATWLALVREEVADESLSRQEKVKRIYQLTDSRRTATLFIGAVASLLRSYKKSQLPLPIKVALPATLGAAAFVGGSGAGVAALGGAVGMPVLLLIFLGSAGITSVIEACLSKPEARNYIGVVCAMIARDEVLRRARKLQEAMSEAPIQPNKLDLPADEVDLRNRLMEIDPFEFERHVMSFFQEAGMLAWATKKSNDAGVDGFARHPQGLILVQCKRHSLDNPVGSPTVQQLKGVIEENEAWRGYIVTTSRFTSGAAESAARSDKVVLIDMDALVYWHKHGPSFDREGPHQPAANQTPDRRTS